jgi:hypothetical protein
MSGRSTGHVGPAKTVPVTPELPDETAVGSGVVEVGVACGVVVGLGDSLDSGDGSLRVLIDGELELVDVFKASRPHAASASSAAITTQTRASEALILPRLSPAA